MSFKRIFDKELQDGEIIFQNEGACNVHERPFMNHNNDRGKGQVMMVYASERDIREDVPIQPEGDPDLDMMAQRVQFKFKNVLIMLTLARTEVSNNEVHHRAH